MAHQKLKIGTRASALARWQADWVCAQLVELGQEVELVPITTRGDAQQTGPIGDIGTQGVFTKEIQRALLAKEIDLAVHSLKDLPTEDIAGLSLTAVPVRENPGDALVSRNHDSFASLPERATIGTGSTRRVAQLRHTRPDLQMKDIRGNVDTRLRKLDEGQYDALILAEAGLLRLGLSEQIIEVLPKSVILPAVGQGALGLETRTADRQTREILSALDDLATHLSVAAERALLAALRGGCMAPVGAWGRVEEDALQLDAVVLSRDGKQKLTSQGSLAMDLSESDREALLKQAVALGQETAQQLLAQGAATLIAESRS